jgi:ATP-binding cassette subfamily G (WHITE) protein 1
MLSDFLQVVFSSIYVIVVYVLTSQPIQFDRMGMFVLICVLTSLVAQSIGILIGAGLSVEAGNLCSFSLNFHTCL